MTSESEGKSATTHATTTEARAGSTPHMTRYVLTIGLILVIILFAIIVLVGRT
jgi:hypothetical protein